MKKTSLKKLALTIVLLLTLVKIAFWHFDRLSMKNIIKEKGGIKISYFFKVIENEFIHTPGAFDSDFTWDFILKVSETDFKSISEQIEKSKFYVSENNQNFTETIGDSLKIYNLSGYWGAENNFYKFHQNKENWTEMTDIEIDKTQKTIRVNLIHL